MINVNLKINHAMTHLPLKVAKGTAKQRLDKAISASDEFFGNVKSLYLKYGDITPELFAKTLRHTAKTKDIQVFTEELPGLKSSHLSYNLNVENSTHEGYVLFLPTAKYSDRFTKEGGIPKTTTPSFMKTVFSFMNKIFNPKVAKRELTVNKYDYTTFKDFYQHSIIGTNNFTQKELSQILKGRPAQEKIDLLQFFRYSMTEQLNGNRIANKCKTDMDRKFRTDTLERVPKFKIKAFDFPNKIKLVEAELAKILKQERANIANS